MVIVRFRSFIRRRPCHQFALGGGDLVERPARARRDIERIGKAERQPLGAGPGAVPGDAQQPDALAQAVLDGYRAAGS